MHSVEAQRVTEATVYKAEEIGRPVFGTEQAAAVEFLLVRGVPASAIASHLGVTFEDIRVVECIVESNKAKERYRDACLSRALADKFLAEAAEYLFVRGFTRSELTKLGFTMSDTELNSIKRSRYWRRLIAVVQKAERADRSEVATEEATVEFLLIRGVPASEIANGLGISCEDIGAVERKAKSNKAKRSYQDACFQRACADSRTSEAAEYLYVRKLYTKEIKDVGLRSGGYSVKPRKTCALLVQTRYASRGAVARQPQLTTGLLAGARWFKMQNITEILTRKQRSILWCI